MPYLSKAKTLAKFILFSNSGNPELLQYLPDALNRATITRDFLLALLFNVKREKYYYSYNIYKKPKVNQSVCNVKIYEAVIKNDYAARISNFIEAKK